jgi:hypothetical protein
MELDWQVLAIAFIAMWLRFLVVGTDLNDVELKQPQGEAGVRSR